MKTFKKIISILIIIILSLTALIFIIVLVNISYPKKNNLCNNERPIINCLEREYPKGSDITSTLKDIKSKSDIIIIKNSGSNKYSIMIYLGELTPMSMPGYIIVENDKIKEYQRSKW